MKQKILNYCTAIFLGFFCIILFQSANSKTNSKNNYDSKSYLEFDKEFSGKARVIDGDSLKVGGKEVRLVGLDAPEYKQNCFNSKKKEYRCGKVSRSFLRKLADKKILRCIYSQKDIYNRFLSKCFINKLSINEEIVKNGMAVIYDFSTASEKMIKLESKARERKIGIWQGPFQTPKDYRKSHRRK